ncbi:MAG: hypothetical protein ACFFCW_44265 [Candidatus Hodarchaeota archaeon]
MLRRFFSSEINISKKSFLATFILVFNTLTWFYMITTILFNILNDINITQSEIVLVLSVHYATIVGSSLTGPFFSKKMGRLNFLLLWMGLGAALSSIPTLFKINTFTESLTLSVIWAISFGIGMPSSLSYFAESTSIENRGRIGGVIYLTINLGAFTFEFLFRALNPIGHPIISAIWRGLGLIIFFSLKPITDTQRKNLNFGSILHNKSFILYQIPWIMFSLVNGLEKPILERVFGAIFYDLVVIEFIVGSFCAIIAGLFLDLIGRKRVAVLGFATLGLAYALLSIAPTTTAFWYFYSIIDGVAWGIFSVIFIMVIWGDLAQGMIGDKCYVIGGIPYFFSYIIQLLLSPYLLAIPDYAAFSLATFFLFVAVLPLIYAPETLPEKKIELRRMRGYIEQAKKIRDERLKKSRDS